MRSTAKFACAAGLAMYGASCYARDFGFSVFGHEIDAVLNNNITAGASWRLEPQDPRLIGKTDLNPTLCANQYELCQGVARGQAYPAAHLRAAPGQGSNSFDDGDLNYQQGDIVQAPLVLNNDIKLQFGDGIELFARGRGLYDPVNYDFTETHPNMVTPQNFDTVQIRGNPWANRYWPAVIGNGALVKQKRPDNIAKDYLFYHSLDLNLTVPFEVGDHRVVVRVGRQVVNWGESTVSIINSLSQANPINANNVFRLGNGLLEDLFTPINMAKVFAPLTDHLSVEGYVPLEWQPVGLPPPGSFYSFIDVGLENIDEYRHRINGGFGQAPDDPYQLGKRLANPLGLVSRTTLSIGRKPDDEPPTGGQYGIKLDYFADWLNNGTDLSFYFANYHSTLPYIDTYSSKASCMHPDGNPQHITAVNTFDILAACPNLALVERPAAIVQAITDAVQTIVARPALLPQLGLGDLSHVQSGLQNILFYHPDKPNSEIVPFDTAAAQLTYPRDIKMYGFSFNTTYGDYSFQGEVAYRPHEPLQVSVVDLGFAAMTPTLGNCNKPSVGCAGTAAASSWVPNSPGTPGGNGANTTGKFSVYDNMDATNAQGQAYFPDTAFLLLAGVPSSARSFPNFIVPYRGGTLGEDPKPSTRIQGWIPGQVMQYTLGATRLYGASDWQSRLINADQVLMVYEAAATHVLNFPKFDQLQIEGPLTAYTAASAGADGSGANGSHLACSTNIACTIGPDGIRFNPYQAPRSAFANSFSMGYRIVARILYESVLPSISISPLLLWQHDVKGNSPAPNFSFVEGRYQLTSITEIRYEKSLSFNIVYQMFGGAGANNLLRDRDTLGFYIKYLF